MADHFCTPDRMCRICGAYQPPRTPEEWRSREAAYHERMNKMPRYSLTPGDKVSLTVQGYVIYSMGGYVKLGTKMPNVVLGDTSQPGGDVVEIPDYMITGEPMVLPPYPDKAVFESPNGDLWRYHQNKPTPWLNLMSSGWYTDEAIRETAGYLDLVRLYRADDEER